MSDDIGRGGDNDPCDDCSVPPDVCGQCVNGSEFRRRDVDPVFVPKPFGDETNGGCLDDDDDPACYRGKDVCDLCHECDDEDDDIDAYFDGLGDDGDHPYDTTCDRAWVPCILRKIDLRERGYDNKGHERRAYRYWAALDKRRHRLVLSEKIEQPPWRTRSRDQRRS